LLADEEATIVPAPPTPVDLPPGTPFDEWMRELAAPGHGVIMTMGKGGVGKTTLAAEIALALAERGLAVTLTTTDPTGHVVDAAGSHPNLTVTRIDPAAEVARYRAQVLAKAAGHLDADGLALIEEDLRSPCTEEIAVFQAFAATVAAGEDRFVVIDTAPTGHTLLLMDATEAYHREVSRTQSDTPEAVRQLLPRLRDSAFTRVLLVALPEPTPLHEAMRLEDDLARAGISSFGWVINRSLAQAGATHPLLAAKAAAELGPAQEVMARASRVLIRPYAPTPGAPTPQPVTL
jgi:arsenite-transporting ATPase